MDRHITVRKAEIVEKGTSYKRFFPHIDSSRIQTLRACDKLFVTVQKKLPQRIKIKKAFKTEIFYFSNASGL